MSTTNFPNGVTNAKESGALGAYGAPDPTRYHTWFDDFDGFEADQWVITEEIASSAGTSATIDADGGVLVITTDDVEDDRHFLQWSGDDAATVRETFTFEAGKPLWFKARWKGGDVDQSDFVIGLQVTDTSPLATTDGVYFTSADGTAALSLVAISSAASSTTEVVATLADDTYVETAFYYNGSDDLAVFIDDVCVAHLAVTNIPTTELAISFGVQTGEGAANTMSVDYIFVSKQRHARRVADAA